MHTGPARGMRDFLPEDVRRRQYVIDAVRRIYERYGFEPLETPTLENIETLTGKYGEEGNKLIFKVLKRGEGESSGEADLALRYDLTVPLARVVADNRAKLPRFFKRYQIQPVWRADRPARGRFREFYQCDVDAIGSTSPVVEVEMIAAVSEVLQALGFTDFAVQLNHRQLLTAMLDAAGIETPRHVAAFDRLIAASDAGVSARANVTAIMKLADATPAKGHIQFTPRLARGLSYYTGAIMEITVPDLAGSLGGGGRYDGLIGMFSGEQIPACGFSLGLERILVVMGERNMFPGDLQSSGPDVLVTVFEETLTAESLRLATELRGGGFRVEMYPDPLRGGKDLGKAFKYADARRARFVAVLGQDEIARGEVKIKELSTGQQQTLPRASVAAAVAPRTSDLGRRHPDTSHRTSDAQ